MYDIEDLKAENAELKAELEIWRSGKSPSLIKGKTLTLTVGQTTRKEIADTWASMGFTLVRSQDVTMGQKIDVYEKTGTEFVYTVSFYFNEYGHYDHRVSDQRRIAP